jgi:hypothetical protein
MEAMAWIPPRISSHLKQIHDGDNPFPVPNNK